MQKHIEMINFRRCHRSHNGQSTYIPELGMPIESGSPADIHFAAYPEKMILDPDFSTKSRVDCMSCSTVW